MKTVTKIEEFKEKRCKIYIDTEFAFVLYKGELRIHKIKEGKGIEDSCIEEITSVCLPKRAKLRLMNLLKNREYTKEEMRRKLQEGFYPPTVIEEALTYVESFGYINDENYAKRYIGFKGIKRSKKRIEMDLLKKGIDKKLLESVFETYEEEGIYTLEKEAIAREICKKKYCNDVATFEERQKMRSYLFRKGYSMDLVKQVFSNENDSIE